MEKSWEKEVGVAVCDVGRTKFMEESMTGGLIVKE